MEWLRLWHDLPNDPKWRVISRKSGCSIPEVMSVYINILTNASSSDVRGTLSNWSNEDVAAGLDIPEEKVAGIFEAMQGKVLDGDRVTGWPKRQPKREDETSTERSRRYRERTETPDQEHATHCNAEQRTATQGDAQKRDATHGDARTEQSRAEQSIPEERREKTLSPSVLLPEIRLFEKACAVFGEDPDALGMPDARLNTLRAIRGDRRFGSEKFISACQARARDPDAVGMISVLYFVDSDKWQERISRYFAGVKVKNGDAKSAKNAAAGDGTGWESVTQVING